jgi:hypothetical protein
VARKKQVWSAGPCGGNATPKNPPVVRVFVLCYTTHLNTRGADMQKVYIVQVQGWGDDENAFYITGAYSTRAKAEDAVAQLTAEAHTDGLTDVVTDIEVVTVDA